MADEQPKGETTKAETANPPGSEKESGVTHPESAAKPEVEKKADAAKPEVTTETKPAEHEVKTDAPASKTEKTEPVNPTTSEKVAKPDEKSERPEAKSEEKSDAEKPIEIPPILKVELPSDEVKKPDQPILTVKVKRFFFFAKKGADILILQSGKILEHMRTDANGQAIFKLTPGEYVVVLDEKKYPINLQDHSTLTL